MNISKLSVWIFASANMVVALAGLVLSWVSENIFSRTLEGGQDAFPPVTKIYINYETWTFLAFAVPLALAALMLTFRDSISSRGVLLFGAVSVLVISIQILMAVIAIAIPCFTPISMFQG